MRSGSAKLACAAYTFLAWRALLTVSPTSAAATPDGWGKARDGLQVGIVLQNPKPRYRHGDILHGAIRVRNVSGKPFAVTLKAPRSPRATLTAQRELNLNFSMGESIPFQLAPNEEKELPGTEFRLILKAPLSVAKDAPHDAQDHRENEAILALPLWSGAYQLKSNFPMWMPDEEDPNRATSHQARPGTVSFTLAGRNAFPARAQIDNNVAVFGEIANGFQFGIAPTVPRGSDSATLRRFDLYIRNATDATQTITAPDFREYDWHPYITDARDKSVEVRSVFVSGARGVRTFTLRPGEHACIGTAGLHVLPEKIRDETEWIPTVYAPSGFYSLQYVAWIRLHGFDRMDIVLTAKMPIALP